MADISISEWLQKAKEDPKQGAIPLVFVAGIAFVVWKFLYSPKTVLINKELKKIKGLNAEMNKFKNAANQLEDIKIDIEEKKAQWANTQKLCYKELERTQFLRRVRELANMSGMKSDEISEKLGISKSTIDSRLFRGKKKLYHYTIDLLGGNVN